MKIISTRYLLLISSFIFIGILWAGCSDNPANFSSNEISAQINEDGIGIFNKLNTPVYYFVIDTELEKRLEWAPFSRPDNRINPATQKQISFEDIAGFEGNPIVINYWTTTDSLPNEVKFVVLK